MGYHAPQMMRLHSVPSAGRDQLKQQQQVNVMVLILSIYSSILALAVWQEKQHSA
jgi:hypothetical protein